MIDAQVAFDKLAGFQSAYEIADFFRSEGIKGFKASHNECPIANWMRETTGIYSSAAGYVVVQNGNFSPLEGEKFHLDFMVKVTPVMKEFMKKFDRGDFPELLK